MKVAVSEIKNTQPHREHGDIEDLKASIADVGLINPITVDSEYNLLAGRRRFQAISELGWAEVECHILPVNGDTLKAFRVTLDENIKRKPLTDPEVAIAIKEYDELKRKQEGERKAGGDRQSIGYAVTDDTGWSLQKTATDLSISKAAVVKAVKIATAIEKYPELLEVGKSVGGEAILSQAALLDEPEKSPVPGIDANTYRRIHNAIISLRKTGPAFLFQDLTVAEAIPLIQKWIAADEELSRIIKPIVNSLNKREIEDTKDLYEVVKLYRKYDFITRIMAEQNLRRDWRIGMVLEAWGPRVKNKIIKGAGLDKQQLRRIEEISFIPGYDFEDYIEMSWKGDDIPNRAELLRLYSFGRPNKGAPAGRRA